MQRLIKKKKKKKQTQKEVKKWWSRKERDTKMGSKAQNPKQQCSALPSICRWLHLTDSQGPPQHLRALRRAPQHQQLLFHLESLTQESPCSTFSRSGGGCIPLLSAAGLRGAGTGSGCGEHDARPLPPTARRMLGWAEAAPKSCSWYFSLTKYGTYSFIFLFTGQFIHLGVLRN